MNITHKLALGLFIAASVTACKKDEEPEPSTPTGSTTGAIRMEFEFFAGAMAYDLDMPLADSAGNLMKFELIRFYVSNATLKDDNDVEIEQYSDKYLLVDASNTENAIVLGQLAPQHVHELVFNVGLDSLTNHTVEPTIATAPLNDGSMWWSWATGYKFIVMEGRWDSDGDDLITSADESFIYHIGSDAMLGERTLGFHQDVTAGTTNTFAIHVDMAQVAASVDVPNHLDTHTGNDPVLAARMRDALLSAMSAH